MATEQTARPTDGSTENPSFDVLLLGRTGMGKSTTGNTLLWMNPPPRSREVFLCGSGALSITKSCKLLTNDRVTPHLRILDSPGFAPSDALNRGYNIYQANLAILREILTEQAREGLAFKRILYFVPGRAPPERADSTLQEEISVMYYFFGTTIFENMILVATTNQKRSKKDVFDDEDLKGGREIFRAALRAVIRKCFTEDHAGPEIPNPPMIYLSLEDTGEELYDNIKRQDVVHVNGLRLQFVEDVCARCAIKLMTVQGKQAYAVDENGTPVVYTDTLCHPSIVRKYGKTERVVGGIFIVVTLGMLKLAGVPWFTDSQEVCINFNCRNPPGSKGCLKVGEKYEVSTIIGESRAAKAFIIFDHTNML